MLGEAAYAHLQEALDMLQQLASFQPGVPELQLHHGMAAQRAQQRPLEPACRPDEASQGCRGNSGGDCSSSPALKLKRWR